MKKNRRQYIDFFIKYRAEIYIFFLAVTVRLFFLVILISFVSANIPAGGAGPVPIGNGQKLSGDAMEYYTISRNILEHGQFSLSYDPPLEPQSFRTPAYPLFISFILLFTDKIIFVSLAQILLAGLSAIIFYKLVGLFFSKKIALITCFLFSLEPYYIYFSSLILSETLFIFLLLAALYLLLKPQYGRKLNYIFKFLSGLLWGCAILTKPIILYFPLVIFVFYIFLYFYKKVSIYGAVAFLLGCFIMLLPWITRNYILFSIPSISSVSGYNLINYNAASYLSVKEGVSLNEAREKMYLKLNKNIDDYSLKSLNISREAQKAALDYIREDWPGYLKFHFIKTLPFFLTDGFRDIAVQFNAIGYNRSNISGAFMSGNLIAVLKNMAKAPLDITLFFAGFLFWLLINLFMLVAVIGTISKKRVDNRWFFVLLSFCLALYFAALTGPVANARYRLVAEPFMLALAVYGASLFWPNKKDELKTEF